MAKLDHADDEADAKPLRRVNIYTDPGIWICFDEGCNSNCHENEWADNAELWIIFAFCLQVIAHLNLEKPTEGED